MAPPPRPPGVRKVKDGMPMSKAEVFIIGFGVGVMIGALLQYAVKIYTA